MSISKPNRIVVLVMAAAALVAAVAYARISYVGTTLPFVAFNLAFCSLIGLIFPRPRSYAFGCFATFLALGFWFKLLTHLIVDYPYVEPIGAFVDSANAWDRVLLWSAAAALGAAVPRCVQLAISRKKSHKPQAAAAADRGPPEWFAERRKAVWIVSLVVLSVVAVVNAQEAIYRVGINSQSRLPRPFPIAIAWTINLGGGLWLATLLHWERRLTRHFGLWPWIAVLAEAIVSSASAMSRAIYLLRMLPYAFVGDSALSSMPLRKVAATVLLLVGFVTSMAFVTMQRMSSYFDAMSATDVQALEKPRAPTFAETNHTNLPDNPIAAASPGMTAAGKKSYVLGHIRQAVKLASDRWIGLEAVMAVSADPDLGVETLRRALTDDPHRGYDSLFQHTARSPYLKLATIEKYTFLTLPGIAGISAYGGSGVCIFAGVLLATAIMMGVETVCFKLTGNPYLTSLVALNLAYVVHQMNFPYLTFVYVCELSISVLAIEFLARLRWRLALKFKVVA